MPEGVLLAMIDDRSWAPFIDGSAPWLHADLILTPDGLEIITLRIEMVANGRQPPRTDPEFSVNVSFSNRSVAEVVPE